MHCLALSTFVGLLAWTPALSAHILRADMPTSKSLESHPLPSRLLHSMPPYTWAENLAVRPNGNILVSTSTMNGTVWQVSRPWEDDPKTELVYNFDEWVDRLIGIGESTPDKYIVVGSRFYAHTELSSHVGRTFCAMELDFTCNRTVPKARVVAWMPDSNLLQGVAALPWDRSVVLISDQYVLRPREKQVDWTPSPGQIWRLDTITGKYELILTGYEEMNTVYYHGNKPAHDVGINGIRILDDTLFWVNSDNGGIYSMKLDRSGRAVLPAVPKTVTKTDWLWDDFAFGPGEKDLIWATGNNSIVAVSRSNGTDVIVSGFGTSDNETFWSPTSAQFGRTKKDSHVLYVTGNYPNASSPLRGWVKALDTTGFHM
ncbi:Six-bladed beta-propeller, TolB-like protein [Metarhizium rileyi]|uniref:Six-bladed beta-propeller, TolB-like protein n=1 Tax=Metarhizium rileyi (strain RCEF 4871) TaxID=1649241 RepID=A0A166YG11_METRR|nr:Six-bladed beta-propeller, TolB-like protein [Metarhizium rileyi RCEF 4871]